MSNGKKDDKLEKGAKSGDSGTKASDGKKPPIWKIELREGASQDSSKDKKSQNED